MLQPYSKGLRSLVQSCMKLSYYSFDTSNVGRKEKIIEKNIKREKKWKKKRRMTILIPSEKRKNKMRKDKRNSYRVFV